MAILAMARDSDGATEWGGYTRARTARYAKWNGFSGAWDARRGSAMIAELCKSMQVDASRSEVPHL
jgi:hypothetical protein